MSHPAIWGSFGEQPADYIIGPYLLRGVVSSVVLSVNDGIQGVANHLAKGRVLASEGYYWESLLQFREASSEVVMTAAMILPGEGLLLQGGERFALGEFKLAREAKNLNFELPYLAEYIETFKGEDIDTLIKFIRSKGYRVESGTKTLWAPGEGVFYEAGKTRRWEMVEEWLHGRVETESWMRDSIVALSSTMKKTVRMGNRWYNTHRLDAAEEIVIKRHILDNFSRYLDEADRLFLTRQIEWLKKYGDAFSH
jgi:hypothetical protein